MAGPTTEVLNDDIKDLRRDIHERSDLLGKEFHGVAVELAELRGELKVTFNIVKWAGALLVTTILTSGAAGLWWASDISAQVRTLNSKVAEKAGDLDAKIEEKFRGVDDRLKAVDEKFKVVDARFDRLESLIIKALDQGRPAMQSKKLEAGADAPVK